MPLDRKYGRVTLERGTVGDDEPVVVLRAQDELAVPTLDHYRELCGQAGADPTHIASIDAAAARMEAWQANPANATKLPDTEPYEEGIAAGEPHPDPDALVTRSVSKLYQAISNASGDTVPVVAMGAVEEELTLLLRATLAADGQRLGDVVEVALLDADPAEFGAGRVLAQIVGTVA
jgi:hypothetical protein